MQAGRVQQALRSRRIIRRGRQAGRGPMARRKHRLRQRRQAGKQRLGQLLPIQRQCQRPAHAHILQQGITQVEADVGEGRRRAGDQAQIGLTFQEGQKMRRQVVLGEIQFPSRQFQRPRDRVAHDDETEAVEAAPRCPGPVIRPLQQQAALVPRHQTAGAAADDPARLLRPGGDARRENAQREPRQERCVRARQAQHQRARIGRLDAGDGRQARPQRTGQTRGQDGAQRRRRVPARHRLAVVKAQPPAQGEAPGQRIGMRPRFGRVRHGPEMRIQPHQPAMQQLLHAMRGRIGGITRIERHRRLRQTYPQLVRRGRDLLTASQPERRRKNEGQQEPAHGHHRVHRLSDSTCPVQGKRSSARSARKR